MTTQRIIQVACHRTGPNWPETSGSGLAAAVTAPYRLRPMSILGFFQAIISAGGVQSDLAPLYGYQKFIEHLEQALASGDLAAVQVCVGLAADLVAISNDTNSAIDAVIAGNSLRLIDVVSEEFDEDAPETVAAADVDAALGR